MPNKAHSSWNLSSSRYWSGLGGAIGTPLYIGGRADSPTAICRYCCGGLTSGAAELAGAAVRCRRTVPLPGPAGRRAGSPKARYGSDEIAPFRPISRKVWPRPRPAGQLAGARNGCKTGRGSPSPPRRRARRRPRPEVIWSPACAAGLPSRIERDMLGMVHDHAPAMIERAHENHQQRDIFRQLGAVHELFDLRRHHPVEAPGEPGRADPGRR